MIEVSRKLIPLMIICLIIIIVWLNSLIHIVSGVLRFKLAAIVLVFWIAYL